MSYIVGKYPVLTIQHNFMQSGHYFLPTDEDFDVVEKAKKTAGNVYIPQHWMDVIRNARKRDPLSVCEIIPKNFLDLTSMVKQLTTERSVLMANNYIDRIFKALNSLMTIRSV